LQPTHTRARARTHTHTHLCIYVSIDISVGGWEEGPSGSGRFLCTTFESYVSGVVKQWVLSSTPSPTTSLHDSLGVTRELGDTRETPPQPPLPPQPLAQVNKQLLL
jgi:hypothetical protein